MDQEKLFKNEILVVCLFTYNHHLQIGKCIESILMQRTNFEFKIFINDDCSNDGTAEICAKYESIFPTKIIYRKRIENLGMIKNIVGTIDEVKSKYVALIEGDDYWIDPLKLQIQYDYFENNVDYVLIGHNAIIVNEKNNIKKSTFSNNYLKAFNPTDFQPKEIGIGELALDWLIPTASIVYRSEFLELPNFAFETHNWDMMLQILLAIKGKIGYCKEFMCVYRVIDSGNNSNPNYSIIKTLQRQIDLLNNINKLTGFKYCKELNKAIKVKKNSLLKNRFLKLTSFMRL